MNSSEITKALSKTIFFGGVFPCDRVPVPRRLPVSYVINTDPSDESGTHWVALFVGNDHKVEYFDSFGFPPLQFEIQDFIREVSNREFVYSSASLQHPYANSCGRYCIAFVKSKGKGSSFVSFITKFDYDQLKNEEMIKGAATE